MRRKVTLSLDEDWVAQIDRQRGLVPRSRYVEMISGVPSSSLAVKAPAKDEGSPESWEARVSDEMLDGLHSGPITEQLETARIAPETLGNRGFVAKPSLQRPIIQKRGT